MSGDWTQGVGVGQDMGNTCRRLWSQFHGWVWYVFGGRGAWIVGGVLAPLERIKRRSNGELDRMGAAHE